MVKNMEYDSIPQKESKSKFDKSDWWKTPLSIACFPYDGWRSASLISNRKSVKTLGAITGAILSSVLSYQALEHIEKSGEFSLNTPHVEVSHNYKHNPHRVVDNNEDTYLWTSMGTSYFIGKAFFDRGDQKITSVDVNGNYFNCSYTLEGHLQPSKIELNTPESIEYDSIIMSESELEHKCREVYNSDISNL